MPDREQHLASVTDMHEDTAGYRFGDFVLRVRPVVLMVRDETVPLPSQPLRLLVELIRRRADVLTHDDIRELLWPDQHIDVTGRMHACVRQIRRALKDDNGKSRFIETVPRKGYRFVGDVEDLERIEKNAGFTLSPQGSRIWLPILAGAIILAVISAWWTSNDLHSDLRETTAYSSDPFLHGRELLAREKYAEAAEILGEAVQSDPEFAPAYAALSEAEYAIGNSANARSHASRAITLDPTYARGYLRRARVSGWIDHDWNAAERDLAKAIELTPGAPDIRLAVAELYLLTGRKDESIALSDQIVERGLTDASMLAATGSLLRLQRRHEEGEVLCREAISRSANLESAHECVYRAALVRRDPDAASAVVPGLATALGANESLIESFSAPVATEELAAFERWRLQRYASGESDVVAMAYSKIVLQEYDEAMYLLEEARNSRSPRLPAALHDLLFVGLFHQSVYARICEGIGVAVP